MPLTSDLKIDASKFDPKNQTERCKQLNEKLIDIQVNGPKWFEVGAEKYRQMRWNGETPLPKPVVIDSGVNFEIPSREKGRAIPCRMFKPENGESKAVMLHIHGGGWVLQSEKYQDPYLHLLANQASLTVISIGYRLAPEHPYPAGPEDCYDAARYLVDNAEREYGCPLGFTGGESAGAHLGLLVALDLLRERPNFSFRGLLLHFGAYDLALLPTCKKFDKELVLNGLIMQKYMDVFLPGRDYVQRQMDVGASPLWEDFAKYRGKLPSALCTIGTEDPLLDDNVIFATRWQMAGGEAVLRVYTGAPHGFVLFPSETLEAADESRKDTVEFVVERLPK